MILNAFCLCQNLDIIPMDSVYFMRKVCASLNIIPKSKNKKLKWTRRQ